MPLFRQQGLNYQSNNLFGEVILIRPLSFSGKTDKSLVQGKTTIFNRLNVQPYRPLDRITFC